MAARQPSPRAGPPGWIRPGWRPWTCSVPWSSTGRTRTSPGRGSWPTTGSPAGTPGSPPSSATARCAGAAATTRSSADCVDRGLDTLQPELLNALRLGVHQLHNMRVSDHAAVGETVELVRQTVNQGAAGFANAVLRRVARGGSAEDWIDHLVASRALPALTDGPGGAPGGRHLAPGLDRGRRARRAGGLAAAAHLGRHPCRAARGQRPGRGHPGGPHAGPRRAVASGWPSRACPRTTAPCRGWPCASMR